MGRKSAVETSNYYNEILDMIKEGMSSRNISDYMKEEYNENISHTAINNYMNKIKSKTSSEYYKKKKAKKEKQKEIVDNDFAKKESFDEVIKNGVSDLNALDNIINESNNLNLNVGNLKSKRYSEYVITTEADIEKLKIQAKRLAIQAVKAKSSILKDEPESNLNIKIDHKLNTSQKIIMQPEYADLTKKLLEKANNDRSETK